MYLEIYNDKKEKVNELHENITEHLLGTLWNKYINKNQNIRQVQYSYNYSDLQKITFIFNNKYRYIYKDIPTTWGSLDISKLIK